ncbi:hypothetical protein MICAE_2370011 [Microcystis aeruginosa PCC 9806]|uniref:Uncharacterized protein n=1 Tax=Microcystis aeruginosa PCC 9806 TaxID=1160282 RepID=I4GWD8_MICAE|nr:hypothetical protein MICAE_2370011 [Microcystis aeruginosa PCC 9806]
MRIFLSYSLASPNFLSIYAYDKSGMLPSRIRLIIKYIDRLRDFQSVKLIDYRENFDYQMVERFLQLLVKASSDINSDSLLQLHNVTPSTYSVFQSAEVQKLWVLGKRQEAKVKREEKYVYLTSLGNAILIIFYRSGQKSFDY